MKRIVLIGVGGYAKSVVDTIEQSNKYEIVGFIDKDNFGNDEDISEVRNREIENAEITIGFLEETTL